MQDIDRVASTGEPPKRTPDPRASRRARRETGDERPDSETRVDDASREEKPESTGRIDVCV
jgi:hypothetical protein